MSNNTLTATIKLAGGHGFLVGPDRHGGWAANDTMSQAVAYAIEFLGYLQFTVTPDAAERAVDVARRDRRDAQDEAIRQRRLEERRAGTVKML